MTDEFSVCAAFLHDTVEDTYVTIEQLEQEFPPEIVNAVRLLTHEPGTDYFEYISKIKHDPVAKAVKLADLKHNSDDSRYFAAGMALSEHDIRRNEKYAGAIRLLTDE